MNESNDAKSLRGFAFLRVFANDDTIDPGELQMLERIALRDRVVDDGEREVLSRIFGRVDEEHVSPETWAEIQRFKSANGIP